MRKNMVMDLIYRGFIYAANYSESHYNPRRSQIKTELPTLCKLLHNVGYVSDFIM